MNYDPFNWFWIVGGDESRFWSSAASGYVGALPAGGGVSRILNEAELSDVLASYGLVGPPIVPTRAVLLAYASSKRWRAETGGIIVSGASIDTSRESQSMIQGAYLVAQRNPTTTVKFKAATGFIELDAAAVTAIADAVGAHVQACFAAEEALATAIGAGTVTTIAEIDAANWPG